MSRHAGWLRRMWRSRTGRWALRAAAGLLLAASAVLAVRLWRGDLALPFGGGDETWARIGREGVLRVGMDASYPPFELADDAGRFSGYDVDLAGELARRWGVTPVFVNIHFDGLYDALRTEKVDLIVSALPYDRTLTRDVLYSSSYFNAGQVLVASAESDIAAAADLAGRRVVVELGAEAHQLARRLVRDDGLEIEILPCREAEELPALLAVGGADAAICDRVTAEGFLAADETLRIVGVPLSDEPYVIAARYGDRRLMAEVEATLAAWRVDGQLAAWEARWFRAGVTP
jgi:ABC-type amino acid transport substrate-binding protein